MKISKLHLTPRVERAIDSCFVYHKDDLCVVKNLFKNGTIRYTIHRASSGAVWKFFGVEYNYWVHVWYRIGESDFESKAHALRAVEERANNDEAEKQKIIDARKNFHLECIGNPHDVQ